MSIYTCFLYSNELQTSKYLCNMYICIWFMVSTRFNHTEKTKPRSSQVGLETQDPQNWIASYAHPHVVRQRWRLLKNWQNLRSMQVIARVLKCKNDIRISLKELCAMGFWNKCIWILHCGNDWLSLTVSWTMSGSLWTRSMTCSWNKKQLDVRDQIRWCMHTCT